MPLLRGTDSLLLVTTFLNIVCLDIGNGLLQSHGKCKLVFFLEGNPSCTVISSEKIFAASPHHALPNWSVHMETGVLKCRKGLDWNRIKFSGKSDHILCFSKLWAGLYVILVVCSFTQIEPFNVAASFWWQERGHETPAWRCFVELSEMKLTIGSQISISFCRKCRIIVAAHDRRKLCLFLTSPGSCISLSWLSAPPGCSVSGHQPGSVVTTADVNAAPSISWQGALWKGARAAWSQAQLLTSALCALFSQRRGNPEVARELGSCRWQHNVLPVARRDFVTVMMNLCNRLQQLGRLLPQEHPGHSKIDGI